MTTPAEMVVLIDAAIAARLAGSTAGVQKLNDSMAGAEFFSMDQLWNLRARFSNLVAAQISGNRGGIQQAAITNAEPGAPGASLATV